MTSTSSTPDATERDSQVTLAELLGAFSLTTDLGLGQPMEHVLRSWVIASRLGEHVGLNFNDRDALYYVSTLAWVGCVADTPELATWFGDDIAFRGDSREIDLAGLPMMGFMLRHVGVGSPALHRLRLGVRFMVKGAKGVERALLSHCLTTGQMAERLGLGPDVRDPLQQTFTRWDGKGVPGGVGGEDIAMSMRLLHLADIVEVFQRSGGADAAVEVAQARRATYFDPDVVDAFCPVAGDIIGAGDLDWNALIADNPVLRRSLTDAELDNALEAIADFTDLRSPCRAGHSRCTAELASRAATLAGLPDSDVTMVRRAALVHDIGLHGLPATILEKPGSLSPSETERMRMHAYYTERMLARPEQLARIGAIASLTNERCDGSGYHRGLAGSAIPVTGRLLAAACAYCAMIEPRPYRPALTAKQASDELRADVRAGRLDASAVDAVL